MDAPRRNLQRKRNKVNNKTNFLPFSFFQAYDVTAETEMDRFASPGSSFKFSRNFSRLLLILSPSELDEAKNFL